VQISVVAARNQIAIYLSMNEKIHQKIYNTVHMFWYCREKLFCGDNNYDSDVDLLRK